MPIISMTTIVGDRYEIEDAIGHGGMGTVYRGVDRVTGTQVAIKQLRPDIADDEQIARFQREGAALRELNHPNIVKMLDAFKEAGQYYLVMEYVSGGDLKNLLQDEPLPSAEVVRMGMDLADALTRAHKLGIIHRDLKPANVLIAEDGTLRLTDFGIAHVRHQETISNEDVLVGTIDYIAPETLNGEEINERVDIWAFGIMLFEMLTACSPFTRDTISQTITAIMNDPIPDIIAYNADIGEDLQDLIYRMLERDVHHRISSVRYVGAILEDIQQGRSTASNFQPRFETTTDDFLVVKRHNLPEQLTEFVGREAEIAEVKRLLDTDSTRLLTILAPGGMGKTRLALEVARRNLSSYEDGVYFVELAPITQTEKIISIIAEALDYQIQGADPRNEVIQFLSDKHLLLVIDNWEHVLAGASLVTEILQAAPQVKIMNTSRLRLGEMGETLFHLSGMAFPKWETPADALEYAAVKLFVNSAKRVRPDFELRAADLDYVARICRLVQGMPLGLLLSAAWVSMLSPQEIADEIQNSMDLLVDEAGELPERQQSIHVVMDYAWQVMTEAEQSAFARLTIFRGGFTRDAAQEIANATLRVLMSLTNKSLIRRDNDSGRYQIHELLRQFGESHLQGSPAAATTRDAHRDYYAAFVKERLAPIKGGIRQLETSREIKAELENIQLAWIHACQTARYDLISSMEECLYNIFHHFGALYEGMNFYETTLPYITAVNDPDLDLLKHYLQIAYAVVLAETRQLERAIAIADAALAYTDSHPDDRLRHQALGVRGYTSMYLGEFEKAKAAIDESVQCTERMNDPFYQAIMYQSQAIFLSFAGGQHQAEMKQLLTKALNLATATQNSNSQGSIKNNMAALTIAMGDWDEAQTLIEELLQHAHAEQYRPGYAHSLNKQSELAYLSGDFDAAHVLIDKTRALATELRLLLPIYVSSRTQMKIAIARGDYATARDHAQQALDIARQNKIKNYIAEMEMYVVLLDFFQTETLSDVALLERYLPYALDMYRLGTRLESVMISAILHAQANQNEKAVELLAMISNHPKCPPVLRGNYAPMDTLRERLQSALSQADFDAAWQRGTERDFDTTVTQLKQQYTPSES